MIEKRPCPAGGRAAAFTTVLCSALLLDGVKVEGPLIFLGTGYLHSVLVVMVYYVVPNLYLKNTFDYLQRDFLFSG